MQKSFLWFGLVSLFFLPSVSHARDWEQAIRQLVGEMTIMDPRSYPEDSRDQAVIRFKRQEAVITSFKPIPVELLETIADEFQFGPARLAAWGMHFPHDSAIYAYAVKAAAASRGGCAPLFPEARERRLPRGEE